MVELVRTSVSTASASEISHQQECRFSSDIDTSSRELWSEGIRVRERTEKETTINCAIRKSPQNGTVVWCLTVGPSGLGLKWMGKPPCELGWFQLWNWPLKESVRWIDLQWLFSATGGGGFRPQWGLPFHSNGPQNESQHLVSRWKPFAGKIKCWPSPLHPP